MQTPLSTVCLIPSANPEPSPFVMAFFSGHPLITQSLLSDSEINQLIQLAGKSPVSFLQKPLSSHQSGEVVSDSIGSGSDFAEVRAYYPGDDPRIIDWRATARSTAPLVRTFYNELSRPLCILLDRSTSMRYATRSRLKAAQALRLAVLLGAQAIKEQRQVAFIILDNKHHWLPAQSGINSFKTMLRQANQPCSPEPSDLLPDWPHIIAGIKQHIERGSELILLSDFNSLKQQHKKILQALGRYCACQAFCIVDPSEQRVEFSSDIELSWKQSSFNLSKSQQPLLNQLIEARFETLIDLFKQSLIDFNLVSTVQDNLNPPRRAG